MRTLKKIERGRERKIVKYSKKGMMTLSGRPEEGKRPEI